jgi:2-polyprenyl-3-methyl-5-hydroxy-6-metoxy-1,4-benzoquinol methylase
MTQVAGAGVSERLAREIEHFEEHYAKEAAAGLTPLSPADRVRYTAPKANTIFPREFYYHLMAPLQGKDTLEIACGNGIDASIAAHNGAHVHAYDISSQSITMVRQRAQINGVADRVQLEVTGHFAQAFPGQTFDVIMGYAALHHIPLAGLAQQVYARLRPGGVAVFAEPVINSTLLHRIRRMVPYYIFPPTEDEKPLNDADIAAFAQPFDRMVRREFQFTSRIWPMFPHWWSLAWSLHQLDYWLLKLPMLRRLATVVVFGLYRDR